MRFWGFDPDSKASGFALIERSEGDLQLEVISVGVIRPDNARARIFDRVKSIIRNMDDIFTPDPGAVEVMQHYKGSKVRPENLLALNLLSGAALRAGPRGEPYLPAQWKGQIRKDAHHRYLEKKVGPGWMGGAFGRPAIGDHWKECWDAIGLALYAAEQHRPRRR